MAPNKTLNISNKIAQKLLLLSAGILAGSLYANDGGTFGIDVRGINPENQSTGVIALEGSEITVTGKDAAYLAARLPNTLSVSPAVELSYKSLSVRSPGWTIGFGCQVGEPVANVNNANMAGPVSFTQEPTCTIRLDGTDGDENITTFHGNQISYGLLNRVDYTFARVGLERSIEGSNSIVTAKGTRIAFYGRNVNVFKTLLPGITEEHPAEIRLNAPNASVIIGCASRKVTRVPSIGPETECFVEVE